MTKKETNLSTTLSEAVSVATSVAYTRQEIQKLKTELVSLLEKKTTELIVEQVPGPVGPRGSLGATGAQGSKGDKGDKGDAGERGEKGEVGPQGNMGHDGPRGLKGDKGDKGEQGDVGPQGEQGIQGITGERGDKGEKGDRGADGQNGLDGRDGQTGAVGPVGSIGPQGVQGERGLKGDKGERGQDGQQGLAGSTGPKGEIGPQGVQGLPGKDGKDGDIKPVEEKFQKFIDNVQKDVNAFKTRVNAVIVKSGGQHGGSTGSGEVNLRYLDDVDRDSITDGYVLSYDQASQKFVFVAGGGGGTIDTVARTRSTSAWYTANLAYTQANSAFSTSNNSYTQANSALSIAQSAFAQANTGGAAGTDNLARSIANSSFSTANSAFAKANTGTSQLVNGASIVSLSANGNLTVPGPISGLGNSKLDFTTYGANTAYLTTTSDDSTALFMGLAAAELYANTTVQIRTNTAGVSKNWTFGEDGTLTFPDNTVQTTAATNIDAFARSIANSAFAQANTGGGGVAESLNVQFNNNTGVAYKVVALNATANTVLASALDIAQVDKVLGVLDVSGETVTFGSITNVSWAWTPEQSLYLGSNGDIVATSTINGAAFSLKLGYAISATKAFIKIGTPIVL